MVGGWISIWIIFVGGGLGGGVECGPRLQGGGLQGALIYFPTGVLAAREGGLRFGSHMLGRMEN